jgi:hypothetical protein
MVLMSGETESYSIRYRQAYSLLTVQQQSWTRTKAQGL